MNVISSAHFAEEIICIYTPSLYIYTSQILYIPIVYPYISRIIEYYCEYCPHNIPFQPPILV